LEDATHRTAKKSKRRLKKGATFPEPVAMTEPVGLGLVNDALARLKKERARRNAQKKADKEEIARMANADTGNVTKRAKTRRG
jgi:hypothetical protein